MHALFWITMLSLLVAAMCYIIRKILHSRMLMKEDYTPPLRFDFDNESQCDEEVPLLAQKQSFFQAISTSTNTDSELRFLS